MKTTHRILGIFWMAICGYLFANLVQGMYEIRSHQLGWIAIGVFYALLFLAGAVASFYVLIGARWARIVLSIVALLIVTASVMGFFAFFNSLPFSFVGIAFDLFALASACVLFLSRKYAVA